MWMGPRPSIGTCFEIAEFQLSAGLIALVDTIQIWSRAESLAGLRADCIWFNFNGNDVFLKLEITLKCTMIRNYLLICIVISYRSKQYHLYHHRLLHRVWMCVCYHGICFCLQVRYLLYFCKTLIDLLSCCLLTWMFFWLVTQFPT